MMQLKMHRINNDTYKEKIFDIPIRKSKRLI